jgi:hypothetical protein
MDLVPRRVENVRTVREANTGRRDAHAVDLCDAGEVRQRRWFDECVRVDECDDISGRRRDGCVAAFREPEVPSGAKKRDAFSSVEPVDGALGAAVVDDDHLYVDRLGRKAVLDRLVEPRLRTVDDDDSADLHVRRSTATITALLFRSEFRRQPCQTYSRSSLRSTKKRRSRRSSDRFSRL